MLPFALLGLDLTVEEVFEVVGPVAGRILLITVIAGIAYQLLVRMITPLIRTMVNEQMTDETREEIDKRVQTLSYVVNRTALIGIFIATFLIVLSELNLNVAPLIAGMGLLGLAIGFGAQNLVRDVINGVFILLDNQYGIGDWVEIGGVEGAVEVINLRRTVLRDTNGTVHFVPHGGITTSSNYTKRFANVLMNVAVDFDTDLDKAFEIVRQVGQELAEDPEWAHLIRAAPRPHRVNAFTDNGIEIRIIGETAPDWQWAIMGQIRLRLKKAFDAEGIELGYPRTKIYFANSPTADVPRPQA